MKDIRQNLIDTMFESLYKEGYNGCNLNAILKRAGTSKGGMYHHFDSKQNLAVTAIEEVLGEYVYNYWEKPLSESENPLQTLYELITALADPDTINGMGLDFHYGCPLNNLIQELSAMDEAFASVLKGIFTRWEQSVAQALMRVRKNLRIDVQIEHAASFIIASIEGCFSYAKVYNSEDDFKHLMEQLIAFIKSLLR